VSDTAKDLLAARVASRWRVPILALGVVAGGLLAARLFGLGVADGAMIVGAVMVGLPALALFACAVFDPRFHNALSIVNTERRDKRRGKRGQGIGDPALHVTSLALLAGVLFAAFRQDAPATALGFAAFNLVLLGNIAILTRDRPTDRFVL
jgi:hypothetical protein